MWALWKEALKNRQFTIFLIAALVGLIAFAASLPYFFTEILLPKPGITLIDPVLNFFTPRDWSIEIFILIHSCTVLTLAFNLNKPKTILIGLQTYVVVNFLRLICLYLFTLEAPAGTIPLNDPVISTIAYGQQVYVKDLFFSGHISTLCIFLLIEEKKILKYFILTSTVIVALLLAWQRVHYTLDMVAAPVVVWGVFQFFSRINSQVIKD